MSYEVNNKLVTKIKHRIPNKVTQQMAATMLNQTKIVQSKHCAMEQQFLIGWLERASKIHIGTVILGNSGYLVLWDPLAVNQSNVSHCESYNYQAWV